MKAVALFQENAEIKLIDVSEPALTLPDHVKLRVLQVGICGTDREEASGGRADAPEGEKYLIIGHEMLGQVVEVGKAVTSVKPGDIAIFTVRRGCEKCPSCLMGRPDMCYTGNYKERGIKELHGYQTEFAVDREKYLIKVPKEIVDFAVLAEPMSVVEKAIDEAVRVQVARLPEAAEESQWMRGKQVLVAGLGPIGLLAALALRLRGAKVIGLDIVDGSTARPKILEEMGGKYIDGRVVKPETYDEHFGQIDAIIEATGIAMLDFELIEALGVNGVFVLTGIPGGHRPISIDGSDLMQKLVLKNQVVIGSVNASEAHFQRAVDDLVQGAKMWPNVMKQLITHRVKCEDMMDVLTKHPADEIKSVIQWSNPQL